MGKRGRPAKVIAEELNPEQLHKVKLIKQEAEAKKNLKVISEKYVITKFKVYHKCIKNNGNEYSRFICNNSDKFKKLIDQVKTQKDIPVEISL